MNIKQLKPPLNFRERANKPELIVLHATVGAIALSSISSLRKTKGSYHYIITRDAKDFKSRATSENAEPIIHYCVPNDRMAHHVSSTIPSPGGLSIKMSSICISVVNIQKDEPYPPKQIAALNELLAHLKATIPSLLFLTTHAVVQPWNRIDLVNIKGEEFAVKHGFEFFRPTAAQIKAHTPKKKLK
jgi:N-acetyl-anhydromuramyl-L-alanine amidase AmpD